MISVIVSGIRSVWTNGENSSSRKRRISTTNREYFSCDDDDDDELNSQMTTKRARQAAAAATENDSSDDKEESSPSTWRGRFAYWVTMKKSSFVDNYIYRTTLPPPPLTPTSPASSVPTTITLDSSPSRSETGTEPDVQAPSKYAKPSPRPSTRHHALNGKPKILPKSLPGPHNGRSEGSATTSTLLPPPPPPPPPAAPPATSHRAVHEKLFSKASKQAGVKGSSFDCRNSTPYQTFRSEELERYKNLVLQFATAVPTPPPPQVASRGGGWLTKEKLDKYYARSLRERLATKTSAAGTKKTSVDVSWSQSARLDVEVLEVLSGSDEVVELTPVPRKAATKSPSPSSGSSDVEIVSVASPVGGLGRVFDDKFSRCPYLKESWLRDWKQQHSVQDEMKQKQIRAYEETVRQWRRKQDEEYETRLQESLRLEEIQIVDEPDEVEVVESLPALTEDMVAKIEDALHPKPPGEVLVDGFNLKISRRDMETLDKANWLNDEVMNFYFNLLMERGRKEDFPSVYACNTFFYPKLMSSGHSSLKRWTRKVDVFSHDYMLIPVHLDIHWCLAVVDFPNRKISYYDSMGGSNNACLQAILKYLEAEHLDKKKSALPTSDWTLENVKDNPRQLNGSDCGMFACKYAEYVSRKAKITFTQEDMPYFRRRMVYEILTKTLL